MQIIHGPHAEQFLKINSNPWLTLQGSPGSYFRKLEIRVKRLLYSAVSQSP